MKRTNGVGRDENCGYHDVEWEHQKALNTRLLEISMLAMVMALWLVSLGGMTMNCYLVAGACGRSESYSAPRHLPIAYLPSQWIVPFY